MTIYVDDMLLAASVGTLDAVWSHLMSDLPGPEGTAELLAFAVRLGLRPEWIQKVGKPTEHFDVTAPKRDAAIRMGAVPIRYGSQSAAITRAKAAGVRADPVDLSPDGTLF